MDFPQCPVLQAYLSLNLAVFTKFMALHVQTKGSTKLEPKRFKLKHNIRKFLENKKNRQIQNNTLNSRIS